MDQQKYLQMLDKIVSGKIHSKKGLLDYLLKKLKLGAEEVSNILNSLLEDVILYKCEQCRWLFETI